MTAFRFLAQSQRTDLAVEARDMFWKKQSPPRGGVISEEEEIDSVHISRVAIVADEAAAELHKPKGRYITLEVPTAGQSGWLDEKLSGDILAQELQKMLPDGNDLVLVVGLGNREITADSLGPKMLEHIVVTRHLRGIFTKKTAENMKHICAVEPGVLGVTGLETFEVIKGIVQQIQPGVVIAVDALAAASTARLNRTIQLADTGIHPGSGVDNKRFGLTRESLGVPVIAIGIPTVVHAATIALDLLQVLERHAAFASYFKSLENLAVEEKNVLIRQLVPDYIGELVVSPKEADVLMEAMARVLGESINRAVYGDFDYHHLENYIALH